MSQQTTKAITADTFTEEQVSQPEIPLPRVFVKATGAGKNAFEAVVTRWSELPRERQRLFTLLGVAVITSVTASLVAIVIARFFAKKA